MAGDKENDNQRVLSYPQVCHLKQVVGHELRINAKGRSPALTMTARRLIETVRDRLNMARIPVKDIRINGSAASCVVGCDDKLIYNDLDVLFNLSTGMAVDDHTRHDRIRSAALSALLDFFPNDMNTEHFTTEMLSMEYVHKMVKINNVIDRWSLISLNNDSGRNIELKFVDSMKRKYQFSIDSFQVIIDSFLLYQEASPIVMNERFFPTVVAMTFYGNFDAAVEHLKKKLIATKNPEEIRGGGLLKYCSLLACKYRLAKGIGMESLEKLMCARFFIDFPTIELQWIQLQNYLANHFIDQNYQKKLFLVRTSQVIQRSAFCLPAHEREQILELINRMAHSIKSTPESCAYNKTREMNQFDKNMDYSHGLTSSVGMPMACSYVTMIPHHLPSHMCVPNLHSNDQLPPFIAYPVYFTNPVIIQNRHTSTF